MYTYNHLFNHKVALRVEEHFGSPIRKDVDAPGLPESARRNLYEPENGGMTLEVTGCMWAITVGYERDLEATCLNTH